MEKFFFCCGIPKSGTTFLQHLLNLHPDIFCPSEHNLAFLKKSLETSFTEYNKLLVNVDKHTGAHGASLVTGETLRSIFRHSVLQIAASGSGGCSICGLNDNSIIGDLPHYSSIMEEPVIIYIVRNPLDQGMSNWRHNHRLAKLTNDVALLKIMPDNGTDLEAWLIQIANKFNQFAGHALEFAKNNDNILIVRYEDLVTNKIEELKKILSILGASSDDKILKSLVDKSGINTMREASANPDFYGSGNTEWGGGDVSPAIRAKVISICKDTLSGFGYDTTLLQDQ